MQSSGSGTSNPSVWDRFSTYDARNGTSIQQCSRGGSATQHGTIPHQDPCSDAVESRKAKEYIVKQENTIQQPVQSVLLAIFSPSGCGRAGVQYAGGGGRSGTGVTGATMTCAEWNGARNKDGIAKRQVHALRQHHPCGTAECASASIDRRGLPQQCTRAYFSITVGVVHSACGTPSMPQLAVRERDITFDRRRGLSSRWLALHSS